MKDRILFNATINNAKEIYDHVTKNNTDMKYYYYFGILLKIDDYIAIGDNNKIINSAKTNFLHTQYSQRVKKSIDNLNIIIKNVNDNINDKYIQKYIDYKQIKKEAFDALEIISNELELIKAEAAKANKTATAKYTQYAE